MKVQIMNGKLSKGDKKLNSSKNNKKERESY